MAACNRRPRSAINSVTVCNERDSEGLWIPCTYRKFQWVVMHPSSKGAFRKRKKSNMDYRNFWKGRILEFKVSKGGQSISEVLIQHVYMHNEVMVEDVNPVDRLKCNCM